MAYRYGIDELLRTLEEYYLPRMITDVTGQLKVPFGDGVLATRDTVIGRYHSHDFTEPHILMHSRYRYGKRLA